MTEVNAISPRAISPKAELPVIGTGADGCPLQCPLEKVGACMLGIQFDVTCSGYLCVCNFLVAKLKCLADVGCGNTFAAKAIGYQMNALEKLCSAATSAPAKLPGLR
ncbi:hypothetical protein DFQ27_003180 [Actinomortierella ambigua]|uniref:Uncharacterized protein n=1 Tax=Actinomortierella ambigua TaxID=1343610 RepID=A0A9P6Q8V7_9FUNG|nr:hypothetical protein DFQ27_003180 [Actinomortierella ambigua]